MFLGKGLLKICTKFTEEHPLESVSKVIEITLWHGCSLVNLLGIFIMPFAKNTSRELLLSFFAKIFISKKNSTLKLLKNLIDS